MNFTKLNKTIISGFSLLAILYVFMTQLGNLNPFVSSWDQVDFALALDRFDLRAMQPHFPGYPYFILGGLLTENFVQNPGQALVAFNVLVYASSILPVYLLASKIVSKQSAVLVAAAIYTASYPLIIVNQPMSEGAALAAFWWFFWSITAAESKPSGKWMLLPLFLFSVLLGIRLSYIPMGIGLIYLFYKKWTKQELTFPGMIKLAVIAGLFQLIWVGGLILTEGSIANFLELAFGFTGGHFQEWGGTSASNELSFFARLKAFLFTNILWWGIFSRTTVLMVLYIVIGSIILLPSRKSGIFKESSVQLSLLLMLAYGGWALFAQNIDKPRHILPVALLIVFFCLLVFFKKRAEGLTRYLALAVIIAQAIVSSSYVQEQAESSPAVYQLAHYLEGQPDDFVLYTWEETRVLQFLGMHYPHKRIYTYEIFFHDQGLYEGKTIYLTNSVIDGFRSQGIYPRGKLEKVKTFTSNEIFDPVYHEIVLYKWTP
ncbi:glycosyltransferase family 39 protein [Bacillus sp. ISL-35]|uniref:glycosyltransferase family 39 protein n=1 Tax=Bacillus sp. ISL-35 TaxID=2819122 RepID=UPI001BE79BF0|nr:glycosyltransferase family 39 protein [Bacillus sp. ISL-35]MBT2681886.1 glycosyltransferase family 39 protein [Bacillus sp. ISL-35]MBT2702363.1 glycosyltransferase family 39 protein [Chryseobacterium sp. ISL-80]